MQTCMHMKVSLHPDLSISQSLRVSPFDAVLVVFQNVLHHPRIPVNSIQCNNARMTQRKCLWPPMCRQSDQQTHRRAHTRACIHAYSQAAKQNKTRWIHTKKTRNKKERKKDGHMDEQTCHDSNVPALVTDPLSFDSSPHLQVHMAT